MVFGVSKALTNYLAGRLSDRFGRKHVLIAWLDRRPSSSFPADVGADPGIGSSRQTFCWGVSQGLTWSTTVIMKIDLVGP